MENHLQATQKNSTLLCRLAKGLRCTNWLREQIKRILKNQPFKKRQTKIEFNFLMISALGKAFNLANSIRTLEARLVQELGASERHLRTWFSEANEIYIQIEEKCKKSYLKIHWYDTYFAMYSKLRGQSLYVVYRAFKPQVIVETGVASGASSFFALKAIQKNGVGR